MKKSVFMLMAFLFVAGCGTMAREKQLPVISKMWESLKPSALLVTDANSLSGLDTAIADGDKVAMPTEWGICKPFVVNGLDQQFDADPNAILKESLTETVNQLTISITTYCQE